MEQKRRRFQTLDAELVRLVAAERLEDLLAGCEAVQIQALIPGQGGESTLMLADTARAGRWLCVTRNSLLNGRYRKPFMIRRNLLDAVQRAERWRVVESAPRDWLDLPSATEPSPVCDRSPLSIALPLYSGHKLLGIWVIGLATGVDNLKEAVERLLLPAAAVVAASVTRVLQYDLMLIERQQAQQAAQMLQRTMASDDQGVLLSALVNLFSRFFGLTRVAIMLVHEGSQSLRGILHTGFDTSYRPPTLPLEEEHSFTQCLRHGAVQIFARGEDTSPSDLPLAGKAGSCARGVLIPLRHLDHAVGLIYADQTEHNGLALIPSVFESIGGLAAVALENVRLRAAAESRAETDALTGLLNRSYLDKLLRIEIPRIKRYNQPISLLMVDLCNFKHANDTHGHQFGDFLLRETGRLIQANIRRPDVAVRYGGDEFVVLMFNTDYEQAVPVRDRIEAAFADRNRLHSDPKMMITISLGLRSADAESIDDLIHEADMEMYAQKARQRRRQLIAALLRDETEPIEAADKVVGSLSKMLRGKLPEYTQHARRVAHVAVAIGQTLELPDTELETLALAALLHDLGMASLPPGLLQKHGGLNANEREALRQHVLLAEEFFQGIEHLEPVRPLIRQHHERWDGRLEGEDGGHPLGLRGKQILLGARILALAEWLETHVEQGTGEQRLEQARKQAGAALDPEVVKALEANPLCLDQLGDEGALEILMGPILRGGTIP